jgi:hypothetical protein
MGIVMSVMELKVKLRTAGWPVSVTNSLTVFELEQAVRHELDKYKPPTEPTLDDSAFEGYKASFNEAAEKWGFESTYCSWVSGSECGCMGPRDGEPYCPCKMRSKTARMLGKVVPNY